MADWIGNAHSAFTCNGASNHSSGDRQIDDYYATHPIAAEWLIKLEHLNDSIWECACGEGHLASVFMRAGYSVKATDLIDRGFGESGIDFLKQTEIFDGDIVTNPPYKYAQEFVEHALNLVKEGNKVCMFLKLTFLESKARRSLFKKYPPRTVYVSSSRLQCAKNGKFEEYSGSGATAVAYAWYVWEKGYTGETVIKWFN
jgi:hypothetical protein